MTAGAPAQAILNMPVPNDTQVTLTWSSVNGATSYNIYQGTTPGGESPIPVQIGITETSKTITGLANDTTYYFTVAAVNAYGTSVKSNEVSATPAIIALTLSAVDDLANPKKVTLTWTQSTLSEGSGFARYELFRATGSSVTTSDQLLMPIANVATTQFVDDTASTNTQYTYGVRVVDNTGNASTLSVYGITTYVSYTNDVEPIFQAKKDNCISCHNGGFTWGNLQATDGSTCATLKSLGAVVKGDLAHSYLLTYPASNIMGVRPYADFKVGGASYKIISRWLTQDTLQLDCN